jgi:hypothetical protein
VTQIFLKKPFLLALQVTIAQLDFFLLTLLKALATSLKLTPAKQSSYTEAIIEETGGDPKSVALSYSSADRSRRSVGKEISVSVKEQLISPKLVTLHWDSKITFSLTNRNVQEERLAVLVENTDESKLLGVPSHWLGTKKSLVKLLQIRQ